jgi:hypothetical protein
MPGMPETTVVLYFVLSVVVVIWPVARICRRIGYSPWLAIVTLVPFCNVLLLWFVAFAQWPVDRASGRSA